MMLLPSFQAAQYGRTKASVEVLSCHGRVCRERMRPLAPKAKVYSWRNRDHQLSVCFLANANFANTAEIGRISVICSNHSGSLALWPADVKLEKNRCQRSGHP